MAQIGVLIIHGMGDQSENFADEFIDRLKQQLGPQSAAVAFEACFWADVLQHHQDQIWQRVKRGGSITWQGVRHWLLSAFGDPPAYLSGFFKLGHPVYQLVHARILASLLHLEDQLDPSGGRPLVVLAHSLGSVIICNYIWDEHKHPDKGKSPFQRTDSLTKLITYGSNIPLFLPPVRPVTCIQFPSPEIPAPLRPHARWINFYAPSDLLGFPLGALWDDARGTVIEDRSMHPGWWPASRTPYAHLLYEKDKEFLRQVVGELRTLMGGR
ncbi:MAG: hypothetical protein A2X67_00045 [Ignavibacteria bacterium GWA2_55_11]|nr:MAG: hypothetical protein A2X67_00045 [Ignavibacteria bacterium GWA2_55_11]